MVPIEGRLPGGPDDEEAERAQALAAKELDRVASWFTIHHEKDSLATP
jgi:hypothetical protein